MSQGQLHEGMGRRAVESPSREAVWGGSRRRTAALNESEPLCRPVWPGERAYERDARDPTVGQDGTGGRRGGTSSVLTRGDLHGSVARQRGGSGFGGNDGPAMPMEKSEFPIVARRPEKAGGAKGGLD